MWGKGGCGLGLGLGLGYVGNERVCGEEEGVWGRGGGA